MPTLRPYQLEDVAKLKHLDCAAILSQQRTGKTPVSLTLCNERGCTKIVIVCPSSMLYKWKDEFETWIGKPCIVLDGTAKQREKKLQNWTNGLCVTYDTFKLINRTDKETGKTKKTGELLHILKQNPDAIIVDEFHRARNPKIMLTKALFKAGTKIPNRIALTGTPVYNTDLDIYSLLKFLYPDNLPTFTQFKERHCTFTPVFTPRGKIFQPSGIKPESKLKIQRFLNKISVQRKQSDPDVMPWLPDKPEPEYIRLPVSDTQQRMLDSLEVYFETDGIIAQGVIDRIMRVRQILIEPRLLTSSIGVSPRTQWILDYMKDYPDTSSIFFTEFTSYIEFLQKYLDKENIKYGVITGKTPKPTRFELVKQFQNKELTYLFIQIQAGKEGLTLDQAENLVLIDQYPPAGDIDQTIERFTATCEERAHIPKRIFKIVMKDSFEEVIDETIRNNLNMADAYNNYKRYLNLV